MTQETERELKIVRYGHPALRERAQRVGRVRADIRDLVDRMVDLMRAARGLGLAANQVGIPRRVAVVEIDGALRPLIDPEIVSSEGSEEADEGCLSLPRLYANVARPARVVLRARDLSGKRFEVEAEGLLARALCHEVDHLNGKLFVDRADRETFYWLLGKDEEGEPITRPTSLDNALRVFAAARRADE
jgi:peptide deformylase